MINILERIKELYGLNNLEFDAISNHEGGRNLVYICSQNGEKRYILRISDTGDRSKEDYLAETEFVHYLAEKGASVADVIPSVKGNYVEVLEREEKTIYVTLFEYAKGMLLVDNGYRYRDGAPLEEYFYNTGKALGRIHKLSKGYKPEHKRYTFFDKYTKEYVDSLIPNEYSDLKAAINRRLDEYKTLPTEKEVYGLIHFDFCDGNYHVDMNTGDITVFDFDNCIYSWYMFDLAHVWTHGVGWCQFEQDPEKRMEFMNHYFDTVLEGYRSETDVAPEMLDKLQLFIDMTVIEYIIDEFECCVREGEEIDYEDIEDEADWLINDIPFAGVAEE